MAGADLDTALLPALLDRLRLITQTPAPPFAEQARADLIANLWHGAGFEVERDEVGNVVATLPGGTGPRVLVAAHLDTVFGAEVDVRVREAGERWAAPGIGDNSASLAVLTVFLERLAGSVTAPAALAKGGAASGAPASGAPASGAPASGAPTSAPATAVASGRRPRLTLAATVGEEGLGDLRGARHLVAQRGGEHDLFVALDGRLGTIVTGAVGSKRLIARFHGEGGHSWGDYPSPSAVHAAGEAIHALLRLRLPTQPRSSLNVGQVWGGTSINAIAEDAGFNLDLRSVGEDALTGLFQDAQRVIRGAARRRSCEVVLEHVGERPAAQVDSGALIACARSALASLGIDAQEMFSSTDANAALAAGLPSIAFGVHRGGDAHRVSEWLEPASLEVGYGAFLALLEALAAS